jgi:hypothetical protein
MSYSLKNLLYRTDTLSLLFAVIFHIIILLILLQVNAVKKTRPETTQNFSVVQVDPVSTPETFSQNPIPKTVQPEIKQSTVKKDYVLSPDKKNIPAQQSSGGSITGFQGEGSDAIKTRGSGEGYGTGNGSGVAYQSEDVYRVAVEEMPEPFGGIAAIQSKAKNQLKESKPPGTASVYILAFIDESGIVRKVQITKGVGRGVDEIMAAAVRKTRFRPGKDKGKIVKVQLLLNIPILSE